MGFHEELEAALSFERFARYLEWAEGDRTWAFELYALNTRVSESLYTPLQMLEVALRNRIHAVMMEARHERWFEDESFLLVENQRGQLAEAGRKVMSDGKEPTPGRLVAALTFSFWTSMLASAYEELWQTTLHRIARRENGKGLRRKDLSGPLTRLRHLRNRVAHHEPILTWNLPERHEDIVKVTGWLSPAAAIWCEQHSRFPKIHSADSIKLVSR